MSDYEANLLIDSNYEKFKMEWERTRWLGYINCLAFGSKIKNPQDILKFTWEEEIKEVDSRTEEEIKEVQEMMIKKMLRNG